MINKLALGTVQFGLDYGINNLRGKVPKNEVFAILDRARESEIDLLDTAYGYGNSEEVLGQYLRSSRNGEFRFVSKLPKGKASDLKNVSVESLDKLGISKFYGYVLHDFASFKEDPGIWELLRDLKASGKADKIGFSLYYPDEVDYLIGQKVEFDIVQIPYNVFDQRFESRFAYLKSQGIEIHVRSAFLQGLVFKKPAELTGMLAGIQEKVSRLGELSRQARLSILELCLGFTMANQLIDRVIVGVDSIENLEEIIKAASTVDLSMTFLKELASLREDDERIILPFNWKKTLVGASR